MNDVVIMKTRVVLTREAAEDLVARTNSYSRLALALRDRLEASNDLLTIALHQLADERGAKDHQYFRKRWLRDQRRKGGL